jgi:2-methylisocitrate lyase-like PEP mutase family enzyme
VSFADLHRRDTPLVLPNAWDVPSALSLVASGFAAIGTTSFGVAASSGVPDGGRATAEANLALARALAGVADYVSVDIEDGYSDDPDQVAEYAAALPADGINLEDSGGDGLIPVEVHAAKIAAVKRRCPGLFVNARTDTYWLGQHASTEATIERAGAYLRAGADGIFVPGATDADVLRELATHIAAPLNVLPVPGKTVAALGALGVRRISTGSLPYRAAVHTAVTAALAVRDGGAVPEAVAYAELQARLVSYSEDRGGVS